MLFDPNLRAIAFDLDDTLCGYWEAARIGLATVFDGLDGGTERWLPHWAGCFRTFCSGIKATAWYAGYLKEGEPSRTELMRLTLLAGGIDDAGLARRLGDEYASARDGALTLFPEALETLDRVAALSMPLLVITNGPADIQRQELRTLGIEQRFDHVFIEGEMGFGKPDPRVFEIAASAVGRAAEALLMVGNSYSADIAPAARAGWSTAWIRRASDVAPSATAPEQKPNDGLTPTLVLDDLRGIFA